MIGFRKYVGLSALLVFGVGYHAVSTREQCDSQLLKLAVYNIAVSCRTPFCSLLPAGVSHGTRQLTASVCCSNA